MGLLTLMVAFQSIAWAEVATASSDAEDAVVLPKIVNNQQPIAINPINRIGENQLKQNEANPQKSQIQDSNTTQASAAANDMADGESIRQLPTLNQPVIDQANVLSVAQKQDLEQRIRALYNQGKAQIGIVIVPTTGQESIFDYAMRIAQQWQLGSAKQDNGLLIAVAVNDHRIHIATGYGLEGVIPDIIASRIIQNQITPFFKQGQYAQGLEAGLTEIERILNLDPEIAQQAAEDLKQRQAQALHEQQAKEQIFTTAMIILIVGILASFMVGNRLSASVAGVTTFAAGLIYGAGIVMSLVLGFGVFFLLITSVAQLILQIFLAGGGRGGGGRGGGGYSGGGGGFGGGGASGSW
nr:TPM domain-containing protein [Acinetobacter sp. ANC 4648]